MAKLNQSHATKQLLAGYCGIIFGSFGVHKFVIGYNTEGFVILAISIIGGYFTYGFLLLLMQFLGLIEGLIYLSKSYEDFVDTYCVNKQSWF